MQHPANRKQAALWCALIGDALGVPYEFSLPGTLPPYPLIELSPPRRYPRAHRGTPVGTWSDDGALMLALLDSLMSRAPFDVVDFSTRMLRWYRKGDYTPDGRVFDIGLQTRAALDAIERGAHPLQAREPSVYENGNGSLMRVLPVAFLVEPQAELVRLARLQSIPTHPHLRSQLCCALYVLLVDALVRGLSKADALVAARGALSRLTPVDEMDELLEVLTAPAQPQGSGYVVDSLWSAWQAFESSTDVKSCLRAAVFLGNDTDTTACIAGGLAGAYYGLDAVPADWRAQMQGRALIDRMTMRIL